VLDAGVHLEVGAYCFFGITLCFLSFLSFFLFVRLGGAGDGRFGVDFGCARFLLNDGWFGSGFVVSRRFWGGLRFGVEHIVGSGFCSLFGGEAVEFILCGYNGGVFGVGRMGGG
jgi:hypothetical protein